MYVFPFVTLRPGTFLATSTLPSPMVLKILEHLVDLFLKLLGNVHWWTGYTVQAIFTFCLYNIFDIQKIMTKNRLHTQNHA